MGIKTLPQPLNFQLFLNLKANYCHSSFEDIEGGSWSWVHSFWMISTGIHSVAGMIQVHWLSLTLISVLYFCEMNKSRLWKCFKLMACTLYQVAEIILTTAIKIFTRKTRYCNGKFLNHYFVSWSISKYKTWPPDQICQQHSIHWRIVSL